MRTEGVAQPPTPLTGGVGPTEAEGEAEAWRSLPAVELADPAPGYASLILQGWDSYQETWNVEIPPELVQSLEERKAEAAALDERGGQAIEISLGAELMQVSPAGSKGGVKWVLAHDDFMFLIRSPLTEWCVSVRYLAAGIWEHGLDALRARALEAIAAAGVKLRGKDWQRTSRADWAFDIWSPAFTGEMRPALAEQVVAHSSTKNRGAVGAVNASFVGRGGHLETLTIGSKGGLQVEVYDKCREITEASGKTWMIDLWEREGYCPPDEEFGDVWRLEVRMGGDFLKNRNIRTHEELMRCLPELLTEALMTRRLALGSETDSNRWRWPMHPLWTLAYRAIGADRMVPLGRYVTGARDAVHDQLVRQVAGTLRSAMVLMHGRVLPSEFDALSERVMDVLMHDPEWERKERRARERYRFVDQAH